MIQDPIVAEVRKVREAHALRHGNDIRRIYADMKKAEERGHWPMAQLCPDSPARSCVAEGPVQYVIKKRRSVCAPASKT